MGSGGIRALAGRSCGATILVGLACCAIAFLWAGPPAAAGAGDPVAHAAKPKGGGKKGKGKKGRGGAPGKAVGQLKRAGCPKYNAIVQSKYSSKVRRAARRWRFEVFHFKTRLKPPINWGRDPHGSRSFRQQLHGFSWMDRLFYSYKRTGDDTPLRQARDIALDWIKSNPRRFQPGRKGFAWHPKAAADRAGYLGFLVRAAGCKRLLNRKQAATLVKSVNAHGAYLSSGTYHQSSNFGLFQDLGLLLLSKYASFEKEKSKRWRAHAVQRFPQTLSGRLSSEGVWLEHSTQYQFLAVRLLREFLKWRPGEERDPLLSAVLAKMREVTGWFVAPNGTYAVLGDTALDNAPEWGYNTAGTYQGLKSFPKSGFAMARQGNSYLATTATFFNTTHKHADELDFELFDRGLQIVNGPGNYGYDREEVYRDYQLASYSHSTLSADGQSFAAEAQNTYGSGIVATGQGAGWFAIEGRNPLLRHQGIDHNRLFLYRPGETLVIVDRVRAEQQHTYHRFFQLGSQVAVEGRGPGELGLSAPGLSGALHDRAAADGDATRALVKGRPVPLQGFEFPGFRQAVPRWSVEYIDQAADADYITTFTLNGAVQRGGLIGSSANETRLVLTEGSGPGQTLSVTRDGGELSVASAP
jgi:Heparinase II/III-like protein/Heparinase II/III N-terminus